MPVPPISDSATKPIVKPIPTPAELFRGFSRVGLSGFGGVLPWARRLLVDTERWLTAEEFNVLLGLCGWRGAVAGAMGLMLGPFIVALVLGLLYERFGELPAVQSMLHGITLVGAGLIIATGIRMGLNVKNRQVYLPFAALAFAGIAWWHWPLPVVMLGGAALTVALSWYRLSQGAKA